MFDALYIGATGMQAQQIHVDTIANNLANVNTNGFKKARVGFADLMLRESTRAAAAQASGIGGNSVRAAEQFGHRAAGVGVSNLSKAFDLGDLKKTESAFDVSIQGDGFFEVVFPDGSRAFSRGGTLRISKDGQLATQGGYPLKPGLAIPENTQTLVIAADGKIQVTVANQATPIEIGQIELVRFSNPQGLLAQGDGLYRISDASGEPLTSRPGENGLGTIAQGFLEGSNVKMIEEMVGLMLAQRAYQASVKVVQASDEMMGMVNALRK